MHEKVRFEMAEVTWWQVGGWTEVAQMSGGEGRESCLQRSYSLTVVRAAAEELLLLYEANRIFDVAGFEFDKMQPATSSSFL